MSSLRVNQALWMCQETCACPATQTAGREGLLPEHLTTDPLTHTFLALPTMLLEIVGVLSLSSISTAHENSEAISNG